ncbi:hypothetical protein OAG68_00935 [bacterium]|nr:hypothetical protein [bacterium]
MKVDHKISKPNRRSLTKARSECVSVVSEAYERPHFSRVIAFAVAIALAAFSCTASGQENHPTLNNGSMEKTNAGGVPSDWSLDSIKGVQYSLDKQNPFEGEHSLLIDSTELASNARKMVAIGKQQFDAKPWRGKRIKLSAAVRTNELKGPARMQLFVRYTIPGQGLLGRFRPTIRVLDEMVDRPIHNNKWQKYDIIVDISEEALNISVGWKMIGVGRGWIDDISFTAVGKDINVTSTAPNGATDSGDDLSDIILFQKARAKAKSAPRQPFFNHWLWLALFSLTLFAISYLPARSFSAQPNELQLQPEDDRVPLGFVKKFAFRFTVIYWGLFLFSVPFDSEFLKVAEWANHYYKPASELLINALAENLFKIEEELIPPNGSGDTTYGYLHVLARFMVSIVLAIAWALIDWRKTDYRISKDLFNSYLRYTLAAALMVYGLAKVSWSTNQFPALREFSLDNTWGKSSPMGVVWNFMGASRPYTVFGGAGEVVGGLLLIFRRTSILGAMVTVGVMTNIVMLNFCYDVPVKIFSVHLTIMGLMILLGASGTIKALIFLTPAHKTSLKPPYLGARNRWVYYPIKAALVIVGFLMPCWSHTFEEVQYLQKQAMLPNWLGEYSVKEFRLDGDPINSDSHKTYWKAASFQGVDGWSQLNGDATCSFKAGKPNSLPPLIGFSPDDAGEFSFLPSEYPTLPQGKVSVSVVDDKTIMLSGSSLAGSVEIVLKKRRVKTHILVERGFRWINEYPFNR